MDVQNLEKNQRNKIIKELCDQGAGFRQLARITGISYGIIQRVVTDQSPLIYAVEIVNNTESTCITGEAYTIEQRVNGEWTILPIKPRKDGAVYAFNDIGYELAPHRTRLFTIHVEPDKYDFESGREYRIVKELSKSRQSNPQCVYCYFTIE